MDENQLGDRPATACSVPELVLLLEKTESSSCSVGVGAKQTDGGGVGGGGGWAR